MLTTIRPGVAFHDPAAQSFRRIEQQLGRNLSTNRTTVPYGEQKTLYDEWRAGKHPDIPVVLDPRISAHVYRDGDDASACAVDSDERGTFWDENGWVITNSREPWHREYRPDRDQHARTTHTAKTPLEDHDMARIITGPAYRAANTWVYVTPYNAFPIDQTTRAALLESGIPWHDYASEDGFNAELRLVYTAAKNVDIASAKTILDEFGERVRT